MAELPFPLTFKRSSRAKRLRLVVKATGIECVMPVALPEQRAWAFIHQHRAWLVKKYEDAVARVPAASLWNALADGHEVMLPFQGREVPLRVTRTDGLRSRLNVSAESFQLDLPGRHRADWRALGEGALFSWARRWLTTRVEESVLQHQARAGLHPGPIRVKRMRTRWGSCGAQNAINLNWLLTFAPPTVLEYVVVHELCHIRHRDHSARFWSLVAEHLPDYANQRTWLKTHGHGLMQRFEVATR